MKSHSKTGSSRLSGSTWSLAGAALTAVLFAACAGSPPEPILILENPSNGERVSFYREIPFKVPADYDEAKHIASWRADKEKAGFTRQIRP